MHAGNYGSCNVYESTFVACFCLNCKLQVVKQWVFAFSVNQHRLNPLPRASEVFVPSDDDVCDIVCMTGAFFVLLF